MDEQLREACFTYLDDLRASGRTNMFGAVPFLQHSFYLPADEARRIVTEWMDTFSDRHPQIR